MAAPDTDHGLHQLFYVSRALAEPAQVQQILQLAQRNNARLGLSGALLYSGGHFAQWLEGPPQALAATVERIRRDRRHEAFSELWSGPAPARRFADWSMAFVGQPGADDLIAQLQAAPAPLSAERVQRLLGLLLAAAEPAA